jgi:hypothetical protein
MAEAFGKSMKAGELAASQKDCCCNVSNTLISVPRTCSFYQLQAVWRYIPRISEKVGKSSARVYPFDVVQSQTAEGLVQKYGG